MIFPTFSTVFLSVLKQHVRCEQTIVWFFVTLCSGKNFVVLLSILTSRWNLYASGLAKRVLQLPQCLLALSLSYSLSNSSPPPLSSPSVPLLCITLCWLLIVSSLLATIFRRSGSLIRFLLTLLRSLSLARFLLVLLILRHVHCSRDDNNWAEVCPVRMEEGWNYIIQTNIYGSKTTDLIVYVDNQMPR